MRPSIRFVKFPPAVGLGSLLIAVALATGCTSQGQFAPHQAFRQALPASSFANYGTYTPNFGGPATAPGFGGNSFGNNGFGNNPFGGNTVGATGSATRGGFTSAGGQSGPFVSGFPPAGGFNQGFSSGHC